MRGFREYRRNEESPFRALTHFVSIVIMPFNHRRNEESPFRALTQVSKSSAAFLGSVEMKRARLGR